MGASLLERRGFAIGTAFLLVAAGAFWSAFVSEGAPYVHHADEPAIVARALRMVETGDLNPRWFRYPSFVLYLQAATASLGHAVTGLPVAPGTEILVEGAHPAAIPYYIAGRTVTVAFSVLATLLTVLLSRRVAGPWLGLLAGAAFAANALVLSNAVFVTVDMPLTFFVAAAALLCAHAASRTALPGPGLCAAIVTCAALAAGTKYNGAVVLAPFAGLFLLRRGPGTRSLLELCAYAVLALVVFVATTPFSLLDPSAFWSPSDGFPAELAHYGGGHLGHDEGSSLAKTLRVSHDALGWLAPLAWLGVVALFLVPGRDPGVRMGRMLLAVLVALAIPVSLARVFFERNCLPFVPLLLALAAFGARAGCDFVRRRTERRRYRAVLPIGLAALVLVLQAHEAFDVVKTALSERGDADARTLAHRWATANSPAGARVLREAFTPHLHLERSLVVDSVFALGLLPGLDARDGPDYVVTSHIWRAFPDLGATPYAALFRKPPAFLSATRDGFMIRVHRLTEPDPPDLEDRLVFRLSRDEGFGGVQAGSDTLLRPTGTGRLDVMALGRDPSLLLPRVPAAPPRRYLLRLVVESPSETTLQLFYPTPGATSFDEGRSVRRRLPRGEAFVDLRFGPVELDGRLRLDPGETPGRYAIRELALYRLP